MMAKIYYHAVPADWRKEQKYKFLDEHGSVSKIDWTEITPDAKTELADRKDVRAVHRKAGGEYRLQT